MTKVTISIQLGSNRIPPTKDWRVALHDIEQAPYFLPRVLNCAVYDSFCKDGKPVINTDGSLRYPGAPEMIPAYSGNMNHLNRTWQFFCYNLLIWSRYRLYDNSALTSTQKEQAVADFNYLYGGGLAWCNGAGSKTNANYIAGTNLDKEDIKMEALTCGGKVLDVIDTVSHGGEEYLQCRALDITRNPPDLKNVNPGTHPELFTVSVISRYDRTVTLFPRSYVLYVPFQDKNGIFEVLAKRTRLLGTNETLPPPPTIPYSLFPTG